MNIETQVKNFYSTIKFPGLYSFDNLKFYQEKIDNNFLSMYDTGIQDSQTILDIGCGTGFITNLLAVRNPNIKIDAVDFCDSIEFARKFSKEHNIANVTYYKEDFFKFDSTEKYDCIVCNGVLHHMPLYQNAIRKIKTIITPTGKLILGVYNRYGKTIKKVLPITYRSELLKIDQEDTPYEVSFSNKEFLSYFLDFKINAVYPSFNKQFVDLRNLLNYKNGGLTVYNLERKTAQ